MAECARANRRAAVDAYVAGRLVMAEQLFLRSANEARLAAGEQEWLRDPRRVRSEDWPLIEAMAAPRHPLEPCYFDAQGVARYSWDGWASDQRAKREVRALVPRDEWPWLIAKQSAES